AIAARSARSDCACDARREARASMASAAPEPWTETDEDEYGVTPKLVRDVREALEAGDTARVRALVDDLHAADLADLLGELETEERYALVEAMGSELDPQVLPELDGAIR